MNQYFDQITEPLLMQSYATLFFVSFILCLHHYCFQWLWLSLAVAKLMKWPSKVPTVVLSRGLGGLAIYISILVLIPLLSFGFIPLSVVFDLDAEQLTLLILSAAPVFSVGLAEDLGYDMSPKARLIASAASSLVAILLFKVWLRQSGYPWR